MLNLMQLVVGMVFILLAAMVFCNALEHLGARLGISEGVTGSVFVAVGTALPEALVPLIAFFGLPSHLNISNEIGIGAILGPPLMLSTLSIALMAFSVWKIRGLNGVIQPEKTGLKRDLQFFSAGYSLALLLAFSHNYYHSRLIDLVVVVILILSYFLYVLLTIRASAELVKAGHATTAVAELLLTKYFKFKYHWITIIMQGGLGFAGLIYFAQVFIWGISGTAQTLGVPAFFLAVVLIPLATELPEKVNSILWIRNGKDTLAVANITGAMVFQGLLLPVLGILLTDWQLSAAKAFSCGGTLVAVAWLFTHVGRQRQFRVWHFSINGGLYLASLSLSLWTVN